MLLLSLRGLVVLCVIAVVDVVCGWWCSVWLVLLLAVLVDLFVCVAAGVVCVCWFACV